MLQDKDRIFQNLYGYGDWGLEGAKKRGAWDNTKSKAFGGNFDYCLVGVLQNIDYRISEDATLGSGETAINLFEQDMLALRATMHIGFLVVKDEAFANLK